MILEDKAYSELGDELVELKKWAMQTGNRELLKRAGNIEWILRNGTYIDMSEEAV